MSEYEIRLQNDAYWQSVSQFVKKRDGCCQMCHSKENLKAHHLSYEDFYNPDNLIALCDKCHSQVHAYTKAFREHQGEIIKACKDVNEAISKIIDPFVIERCAELSPDGDLHFFTGSWNSRVNLNDFIDKLISLDPYRNGYQATGDFHNYTHAHGSSRFTRYNEMRLKKKRGNDK